jgi:hypothetical protein
VPASVSALSRTVLPCNLLVCRAASSTEQLCPPSPIVTDEVDTACLAATDALQRFKETVQETVAAADQRCAETEERCQETVRAAKALADEGPARQQLLQAQECLKAQATELAASQRKAETARRELRESKERHEVLKKELAASQRKVELQRTTIEAQERDLKKRQRGDGEGTGARVKELERQLDALVRANRELLDCAGARAPPTPVGLPQRGDDRGASARGPTRRGDEAQSGQHRDRPYNRSSDPDRRSKSREFRR